jgi:hypothetical protein
MVHLGDPAHDVPVPLSHSEAFVDKVKVCVDLYNAHWALGTKRT